MKKLFLLVSILACLSTSISAGTSEFEFTYTDSDANISAIGNKVAETIDVAIKIDNPALAGMQVKKITAYTNTVNYLSNTSVWLSSNLTLKNDVNVPDIMSQAAPVTTSKFYGEEVGAIEYTFDEPYTLTTSPLYVGYSMTVDRAFDMGTNYPIIISKVKKDDCLFLHTSQLLNYKALADDADIDMVTAKAWVNILEMLGSSFCFPLFQQCFETHYQNAKDLFL